MTAGELKPLLACPAPRFREILAFEINVGGIGAPSVGAASRIELLIAI